MPAVDLPLPVGQLPPPGLLDLNCPGCDLEKTHEGVITQFALERVPEEEYRICAPGRCSDC